MKWVPFFLFSILVYTVMLLSCQKELSCEDCYVSGNQAPIAKAGADTTLTLPSDSAVLDGSGSHDPDGRVESYHWRQVSGPVTATIISASARLSFAKGFAVGVYLFELKVTDNAGLSGRDTVQVNVGTSGQYNRPPRAEAGPDKVIDLPSNRVYLDGRGSTDPDNNIVSYSWAQLSGPNSNIILSPNAPTTVLTNLVEGSYLFELRVVDAGGLSSTDTVRITVNPQVSNPADDVSAGPDIILTLPLDSVCLEGKWLGMRNSGFQWTKISGPPGGSISTANMLQSGMAITTTLVPGLHTFSFSVQGAVDTMTVLVIDDPADRNTITFKNIQWSRSNLYGTGALQLNVMAPAQPHLFRAWNQMVPSIVYLQADVLMPWVELPSSDPFSTFTLNYVSPRLWVERLPNDPGWVGRESSIKVKLP